MDAIKQPSNKLILARARINYKYDSNDYDEYDDIMRVSVEGFEFKIKEITESSRRQDDWYIPNSVLITASFFESEAHKQSYASRRCEIDVGDYAELRGYTKGKANKVLDQDIDLLMKLMYKEGSSSYAPFYESIERVKRRGSVIVFFSKQYYECLRKNRRYIYMPKQVCGINHQQRMHAYHFMLKIASHKAMNGNKSNENILRVATLLESSPKMKSVLERIDNKSVDHIKRGVFTPFVQNMNALDEVFSWSFTDSNGVVVDVETVGRMPIHKFKELRVKLEWMDYPCKKDDI